MSYCIIKLTWLQVSGCDFLVCAELNYRKSPQMQNYIFEMYFFFVIANKTCKIAAFENVVFCVIANKNLHNSPHMKHMSVGFLEF